MWTRSSQNHILRYEQFPNFRILKIEDVEKDVLFNGWTQLRNINGYPIRTVIANEPPRVMKYLNSKTNKTAFGGYSYNILDNFVKYVNATLVKFDFTESYNMETFLKLIISREIDICVHPYMSGEDHSISFPIKTLRWEIMVPLGGKCEPYLYFILPFEEEVWVVILLTFVYITIVSSLMQFLVSGKFKWMESFCEVLLRFLNMSSEVPLYNGIINILALKFQLLVFGFIMNNLYLAHLTTFLATDLDVKNIDTIEELVQRDIKLIGLHFETERLLKLANHEHFERILIGVPSAEMNLQRNKLRNTSCAFA